MSSSGTIGIGEAPQLSCPNPANTIGCSTYAEYDDGASVFDEYWNFSGTSLPSSWQTTKYFNGSINDGLIFNSDGYFQGIIQNLPYSYSDIIVETYGKYTSLLSLTVCLSKNKPEPQHLWYNMTNGYCFITHYNGTNYRLYDFIVINNAPISLGIIMGSPNNPIFDTTKPNNYYIISDYYISPILEQIVSNGDKASTYNNTFSSLNYLGLFAGLNFLGLSTEGSWMINWVRVRNSPPNGVMPSVIIK